MHVGCSEGLTSAWGAGQGRNCDPHNDDPYDRGTKAQRGEVTCLRSHSYEMAESGHLSWLLTECSIPGLPLVLVAFPPEDPATSQTEVSEARLPSQLLAPESRSPEASLGATTSLLSLSGSGPLGVCQQSSCLGLLCWWDFGIVRGVTGLTPFPSLPLEGEKSPWRLPPGLLLGQSRGPEVPRVILFCLLPLLIITIQQRY